MSSPNETSKGTHDDIPGSDCQNNVSPIVQSESSNHLAPGKIIQTQKVIESARASRPKSGSIRNDLIAAQLLMIAIIVLAFGGTIFWLVWRGTYRQVESDLLGAAQLLVQDLRSQNDLSSLTIARAYRHRFGPAPRDQAYFAIWDQSGHQIGGSEPLPPHTKPLDQLPRIDGPRPFVSRTHGAHLEVIVRGPGNEQILVGRPLAKELDGLQRLLLAVSLFGLLSLAVGGIGAWWLARRIIRPLEQMTQTAEQISLRHLDQRLEMRSPSNEVTRLAAVVNTMLDRLQESIQQQLRFTADASHELRTPVAVILSQTQHSLSRPRSSEEYCAALNTCEIAAGRMKGLIDNLLDLVRADTGRLELSRKPLDLAEVVKGAVSLLEPLAAQRNIRLTTQLLSAGVDGDAQRLNQVVTNLVTNAIRYNRPEGNVSISVFMRENRSWLVVSDSGIGIPTGDQPRIFERFFRADPARTFDDNQGTGLGLSIVAEIVSAHCGTIEIVSQPDQGTTVNVQFPAIDPLDKPSLT